MGTVRVTDKERPRDLNAFRYSIYVDELGWLKPCSPSVDAESPACAALFALLQARPLRNRRLVGRSSAGDDSVSGMRAGRPCGEEDE